MKKTRLWMIVIGCVNVLESILNAIDRNGYLARIIARLADSEVWVDVEFVHHLISLFLLTAAGQWCSINILRKSSRKDCSWFIAIGVLAIIPVRIIVHHLAMQQYIWIP